MLEVADLKFGYNGHLIFENLSFTVDSGEFVFLIGKSGCGKTTLLQLLYFNLFPESGEIRVGEYAYSTLKKSEIPLARRKMGYIFQDFRLLRNRTVYENLAFVLEVVNTPSKLIREKINAVLTEVGLNHRRHSLPGELSGGEQQRVAIARAIVNDPFLIIADEPTGNLDPETSLEILDLLKRINKRGTAVLMATHNYDLLATADSKIYRLENRSLSEVRIKQ
ncbi:MAG: ATP-binding cassette domain-containing protein [Ignavibacteriaceae bacterium]|nr:ATP-binding cassette domain-containing protein [Ignavibacteriaceae bacterium]NUM69650.1 ATP-binding cassette domain-containing protein [Ignavibacteriaceae bacterium]